MLPTQDLNILSLTRLAPPRVVKDRLPMTEECNRTVVEGRATVKNILQHQDPRMLVVVGPCSVHDPKGAMEYARKLAALREELKDRLYIVMRVYFEKPRTTVGWKGLINDPHLDGSYDIENGVIQARELLLNIAKLGLPAATEFLDSIVPQYIADPVSWAAIGARTTESQTHREMASGLSMPHSPRVYRGELWVLNSGTGFFGRVDRATGKFEPVTFCPVGTMNGIPLPPFLGMSTLWNPAGMKRTESPALTVSLVG